MEGDIRLGTCAWSYEDWKGPFYPEHLASTEWLSFYARSFAAVEVDSTFYGVPPPHVLGHWLDETPDSFSFACKLSREITHERHLRDCSAPLDEFLRGVAPLHARLGCILVQLPPSFSPAKDEEALKTFLAELPADFRFAIEFRNAEWHLPRIVHLLEKHRVCWVWNDLTTLQDQNRAVFEFLPQTTDFLYLRLMGDPHREAGGHRYTSVQWPRTSSIEGWAMKIGKHAGEAAPVFVFIGNHFEGFAPESVRRLASRLGTKVDLPGPEETEPDAQMKLL